MVLVTLAVAKGLLVPTLTQTPIVYGGVGVLSTLTLAGTSNGSPSNAYVLLNPSGQGNVGIGTTAPSQMLTVNGNVDAMGSGNGYLTEIANAGTTGTTAAKLPKLNASGAAVIAATTDTDGMLGVVVDSAGTTGNAQIAIGGQASCVFDGATTAGAYVTISPTTARDCHDAGASRSTTSQNLGRVLSTKGSAGTYVVAVGLSPSDVADDVPVGSGAVNYTARWLTPTTIGTGTLYDNGTRVGIGTTSPYSASTLDIREAANEHINFNANVFGTFAGIAAVNDAGTSWEPMGFYATTPVGIGTASPYVSSALDVREATNEHINFDANVYGSSAGITSINDAGSAFEPMTFYATAFSFGGGSVGIGTTAPQSTLHMEGTAPQLTIQNSSGNSGSIVLENLTPTQLLSLSVDSGATAHISAWGSFTVSAGTGYPVDINQLGVNYLYAGQGATAVINGNMAIGASYVTPTAPANGLIVQGNVGIGTTSPAQTLEVNGTAKIDTALIAGLHYPAADSTTAIQFDKANGTTNVMNIDTTNSRVGIGTAAAATRLDVEGNGGSPSNVANFVDDSSGNAVNITATRGSWA